MQTYDLLANIDPATISVGETALITVKKQMYDGSVQDFPSDQLFEVGMMEGCAAGALVHGTDTSAYFNGIPQPIIFAAADSLENDEETVRIGVGLVEQLATHPKEKKNKIEIKSLKTQNESIKKEDEILPDIIIVGGTCFGGDLVSAKQAFGDLLVDVNCDTTRPLLDDDLKNSVIIEILRNMFSVKKEINNDITCSTNLDDQGGWAASILPPFTGDYYKSYNSYYYIDTMMFSLSWGYCINEINKVFSTPTIIDDENGILSGIQNISQREDVLKDLNAILEVESEGRKLIYYPLPKTREHELKHISQYKDSLKQYYDVALNAINWIETPPVDWCKILSISKYLDMRKEKFDQFLKQATENYLESNKNFKEKYEDEAVEAGLDYVRNTLIPEVIRFPN